MWFFQVSFRTGNSCFLSILWEGFESDNPGIERVIRVDQEGKGGWIKVEPFGVLFCGLFWLDDEYDDGSA